MRKNMCFFNLEEMKGSNLKKTMNQKERNRYLAHREMSMMLLLTRCFFHRRRRLFFHFVRRDHVWNAKLCA